MDTEYKHTRICDMLDAVLDEHWPLFLLGSDEEWC